MMFLCGSTWTFTHGLYHKIHAFLAVLGLVVSSALLPMLRSNVLRNLSYFPVPRLELLNALILANPQDRSSCIIHWELLTAEIEMRRHTSVHFKGLVIG
ncbi:uncharacterized protein EI90DRAFT_3072905 [Cantharellus anzutake]|uniref:uncharacterized protein n=1 Tax=Cantharellus anzutake TaxID=1750568 RepID=UPI001904CEEF|nr:uncharacterized protein EI90DRAFT_3072905 [Cantharellus anzutake]KAF8325458.1 hypothetical protein EI90DRAFT_3072905 [Cantharellus anzutake]